MKHWNKLKIDTSAPSVSIDNMPIEDHLKKISFNWEAGKKPEVEITLDCSITLEGIMLDRSVGEIICSNCGKVLGMIVGSYDIRCPDCGHNCFNR